MAQIKDLKRMCKSYEDCTECGLYDGYESCGVCFLPDSLDEIVDEWVKEHSAKTYAMDFFEKFPNAPKDDDGNPVPCITDIYGNDKQLKVCSDYSDCDGDCIKCWNQEMDENDD